MIKRRVTPNVVFGRLLQSARNAAKFRGHTLGRFANRTTTREGMRIRSTATCKVCRATVSVDTYPEPNGIDIGGDAVAIGCYCCELCGEPAGEGGAVCPACKVNHDL